MPELLQGLPTRIPEEEARDLRWFFSNPHVAAFGSGGGLGEQLERAAAYGYGALPCRRCGGRWRVCKAPKDSHCSACSEPVAAGARECAACKHPFVMDWQDGTGLAPRDQLGKRVTYAQALAGYRARQKLELKICTISRWPTDATTREAVVDAFARRGERVMTDADLRELFPRLPDEECQKCKTCKGLGVIPRCAPAHDVVEVTAWPTGSSKQVGGRESLDVVSALKRGKRSKAKDGYSVIDLRSLDRYLATAAMIRDAAAISPAAGIALEEFFSPGGGREALRVLTPNGLESEVAQLEDHMGQIYHLVAWGAS